jgi:hypothetical protein
MSKPTDTTNLLHDLESLANELRDIQRKAEAELQQFSDCGATEAAQRLSNAAICAGMPASRAINYAEEYAAAADKAKRHLRALIGLTHLAQDDLGTLVHIATVVPHRCPNPGMVLGRAALVLTN